MLKRPKGIENRRKHGNMPGKWKRTMHFGCWTLQEFTKKVQEIPFELKKLNIDVTILSEINKNGKWDEYLEDFIHFWSGVNKGKRAHTGVSIVIKKIHN
jgi:hypothetical protein